jgi:hypothetical protein
MKSKEQIKQDFIEEALKVWKNYHYPEIEVIIKERNTQEIPLMSIKAGHTDYSSKAIGLNLTRGSKKITLYVTDESLRLSEDKYRALLRHEALHIGYPRHDNNFKYYAK